jgi:nitrate/nitrite transport system substrate-binding protein
MRRWPTAQDGRNVAQKSYVNTDMDVILERMLGRYQNGLGKSWDDKNA